MKGAEWVKFPGELGNGFTNSYDFNEIGTKTSGNVWKLNTDPPTYINFGSAQKVDPPDSGKREAEKDSDTKPGLLGKMLRNYQEKNPEPEQKAKVSAPAPSVSKAAKDAARLAEALAKPAVAEDINNRIGWGESNLHGRLMLFAAQLEASGDSKSANSLASALFKAVKDDSAVIDGAISHLADSEYDAAAAFFFEDTDWEKYRTTIRSLLEKYPRGWHNAPAVALLLSHLEKHSTTPHEPSIPGIRLNPEALVQLGKLSEKQAETFSDEDLARARGVDLNRFPADQRAQIIAMLREQGMDSPYSSQGIWLLPSGDESGKPGSSPIETLKAMGMDGLIAFAAVATDESLIPLRHSRSERSYYSSNESPAAEIRRRYSNLVRPTSRGEIAVDLISSVLPAREADPYSDSSEPDPAELSLAAIEFWKQNKGKSTVELASLYIAGGSPTQQSHASSFLASSKDPAAHLAFEKAVLESEDPLVLIGQVDEYLGARKASAKTFAAAYIRLLRENPPNEDQLRSTSAGYQIREAGGLENYLKRLSLKVGDASLGKMITDALGKKVPEPEPGDEFGGDGPLRSTVSPVASLAPAIEAIPLSECLLAFGKASGKASPGQWMEIHQLLLGRIYHEYSSSDRNDLGEFQALPDDVIETWKPLMARPDALQTEGRFPEYARAYGANNVGDASTLLLEMATSPGLTYTMNNFAQAEGDPDAVMTYTRKRVAAWSSGKEAEPWPDAERVPEERSKEIASKLATLKAVEIIPYAKSLGLDERFALIAIVSNYGDADPTPPGILELRTTIVSLKPVYDQDHDAEAAAKLGIVVGDRITPELLTRISDDLLKDPASNSTTTVMIFPAAMNLGSNLYVTTAKDLDPLKMRSSGISYLANLFDQFENPAVISAINVESVADMRTVKDGKPVTLESEGSGLEELEKALESKSPTLPYIRISVLSREDAEKISNQE